MRDVNVSQQSRLFLLCLFPYSETITCMLSKQYWTGNSSKKKRHRDNKSGLSIIKTSSLHDLGSFISMFRVTVYGGFPWSGSGEITPPRILELRAPLNWEQLFLISVTVPLSCKMCLERQQNPCYWYIHQSRPDSPRSCHSSVQWPIFLKRVVGLYFFHQSLFLLKGS